MRDGLKIIKLPGDYYGGPTRIAWVRRVAGDEYEIVAGSCLVTRDSGKRLLEHIAADGPGDDHTVWPPAKLEAETNRFEVLQCFVASEKAWEKHCPRPKDWAK
jgi:hypothetical protein